MDHQEQDHADFHKRCMRCILGITSKQQIQEHITTVQVRRRSGLHCSLEGIILKRRLRWLRHVARMKEDRAPKQLLFGWLPKKHPIRGPRLRWRNDVRQDLRNVRFQREHGTSWLRKRSVVNGMPCWHVSLHH